MLIWSLLGIILINAISNTLGTLKNIFTAKKFVKPLYIITFIDAIIFATVIKQVSNSSNGVYFITAYAIGKVLGAYIANKLEDKLALGISEVDIFVNNKDKMKQIADEIRDKGYTVNTYISYGKFGIKRYVIEVTILRKELYILKEILTKHGYEKPTLKIKEVNNYKGKISLSNGS
jgi:uncharacterized protein YebE (UPF0316 family)